MRGFTWRLDRGKKYLPAHRFLLFIFAISITHPMQSNQKGYLNQPGLLRKCDCPPLFGGNIFRQAFVATAKRPLRLCRLVLTLSSLQDCFQSVSNTRRFSRYLKVNQNRTWLVNIRIFIFDVFSHSDRGLGGVSLDTQASYVCSKENNMNLMFLGLNLTKL